MRVFGVEQKRKSDLRKAVAEEMTGFGPCLTAKVLCDSVAIYTLCALGYILHSSCILWSLQQQKIVLFTTWCIDLLFTMDNRDQCFCPSFFAPELPFNIKPQHMSLTPFRVIFRRYICPLFIWIIFQLQHSLISAIYFAAGF